MTSRLGIFDSGVGGFTVLKRIVESYGDIPCVYLGDTARLPYGSKSFSEIRVIAEEVVNWLVRQDVTAILVACNTTNSLAMDLVEKISALPVLGLIESATEMIIESRVGVLATSSTVASKAYSKQILNLRPKTFVIEQACPGFVPMIETGQFRGYEIRSLARKYLRPLLDAGVECIVLGCSHYPLLHPILKELLPNNVRLIDPSIGLAKQLGNILKIEDSLIGRSQRPLNTRFCTTSDPKRFAASAQYWLGTSPEVELVSLRYKACVF